MMRCGLWRGLVAEVHADPFEAAVLAVMAFVVALTVCAMVWGWDEPVAVSSHHRLTLCVNPRPRA